VRHTFIAYVEDKPGVLNRVASLFRRRGFNIDSLTVGQTAEPGTSRMTVVLEADADTARRVVANLYKLVNVLRVEDITEAKQVVRDLALVKVNITEATRAQVLGLAASFRAHVVEVGASVAIFEIAGTQDKIDGLVETLRPFGIVEMVRTGAIAMTGAEAPWRAVVAA
jgi:acetolactate synthase-1/3 small subunit